MDTHNERSAMVRAQLEQRGIHNSQVLQAMASVPRHLFVPAETRAQAYGDHALPIDEGQTISQPFIVALMAQTLDLTKSDRVLEIGTGSGYAAAVLSLLAGEVYTIERWPSLAQSAGERLRELGYLNVYTFTGDGSDGLPAYAPFDAITVAAASPWVPKPLREQLSEGGRMVIPVGGRDEQMLLRITRTDHQIHSERMGAVRFVPLIGDHAWEPNTSRQRTNDSGRARDGDHS